VSKADNGEKRIDGKEGRKRSGGNRRGRKRRGRKRRGRKKRGRKKNAAAIWGNCRGVVSMAKATSHGEQLDISNCKL